MHKKPRTIIDKIWDLHIVPTDSTTTDLPEVLAIDFMLIHEVTSVQALRQLEERNIPIADTSKIVATLDHSIPTRKNRLEIFDDAARIQVAAFRELTKKNGIQLFDFESGKQGIVHVIGPELGLTQPGMTIVCGDSHTSTHGAFGALAFGIGTSEVAQVLAAGALLQRRPKTMRVAFQGKFSRGVFAKDAILKLIAEIGISGGNGHIIEYSGEAIRSMSMEERMTVCNMSIECGARAGLIAPDETTFTYLKDRCYSPKADAWGRSVDSWRALTTDEAAIFDKEITIDVSSLKPMVTWGTNPEQVIAIDGSVPIIGDLPSTHQSVAKQALDYIRLTEGGPIAGTEIEWAFIGSCTNGRIEDLRIAAAILKGKTVHSRVTLYVVPGSEAVSAQAEAEGLRAVFESAGAEFRMPGCSMCLGMNDDKVPRGQRCISTSNRNFMGRQGPGSLTHLASPATVAASAIEGRITSGEKYFEVVR